MGKKCYWNPSICTCENRKYLKNIADTSAITCDEVISFIDIRSTKMLNTIATNVSKNSDDKRIIYKFYYYILLVIILLLIFNIICCHYAKHRLKQKNVGELIKWKIINIKKLEWKTMRFAISTTIRFEDIDFDNILIDEKL